MKKISTYIKDLYVIEFEKYVDERGYFNEKYNEKKFRDLGIKNSFVQDNHSSSKKGVVRGLHAQEGQAKLVSCIKGTIFDVAVDIRKDSSTFLQKFEIELSDHDNKLLFIPSGFLHGFKVLSEYAEVLYKVDDYYKPDIQFGVHYLDKDINISWPKTSLEILSERDASLPNFREL